MKCPTCGREFAPERGPCPECTFESAFDEFRESLLQKRSRLHINVQKAGRGAGLRWATVLFLLVAVALACGAYLFWQYWQTSLIARQEVVGSWRSVPVQQSHESYSRETRSPQDQTASFGRLPSSAAARKEWENALALEKQPGGSYDDRITLITRFIDAHPQTAESIQAWKKLSIWQEEGRVFHQTEIFERDPSHRICEILAQWQRFYEFQTTGLRRSLARERIQYWTKQVEDYIGDADLTVHSASGLPATDIDLFGQGPPDPYFELLDGGKVLYRSRTFTNNPSPIWDETVRIYLWRGLVLNLEIWDDDPIGRKLLLHRPLLPLPVDGPYEISNGRILINLNIQRTR